MEPHWGCLIDKCAVFHGLLCLLLPEGTPHWYWKIKRAVSEYCSPFEILHEVFAGEKLFVLLLKQQNKSCFHGIMTNSPIILGNATSQKATPAPKPLLPDLSAVQFTTLATLRQSLIGSSDRFPNINCKCKPSLIVCCTTFQTQPGT